MPDRRKHRGAHPQDSQLFSTENIPVLREALDDFTWLLSKGYPEKAALKLVGDRFRLKRRQRMAVNRCACSCQAAQNRWRRECSAGDISGKPMQIDGFNLLITIESALSGGLLLEGVDGCYRDLASIHGSYKRVMETEEAVVLIGQGLDQLGISHTLWLLDQPVSNSGRMLTLLYEVAERKGWNWEVSLLFNPDQALIESKEVVVSSDSMILDRVDKWFNLARHLVDRFIQEAHLIHLGKGLIKSKEGP
jgi:hypothetical protein